MKKRKIASVFLSLCLITSLVSYPTQAEEKNTNKMLVHYDFNELNGDVAEEAVIKDISGNGHDAVAKGSGLTAEEGILSFPGGNYGSDAGFVELPKGLFDGKTDLTVSIWMKNETGAGNYTGFYIGTPADNDTNYPPSYFLLNPCNPSNVMKAVITNSVNAFGPFNTEVGLGASGNASDSFKTDNSWSLYTVVFTENTLTGYLNGQKYKTYNIERSIADLGTDLLSYVGKSPYQDQFYKGGVKELQIYEMALSDEEVEELYLQELSDEEVLWKAESEVVIPEVQAGFVSCNFVSQLTLAASVMNEKVAVTWKSSDVSVVTDDGVVKDSGKETSVVLTATLSYGQAVREKKITVTIIPGGETQYSMVVDPENKGVEISQSLIGLFFEDINSAADGGINPELVKNSSFENYFNVASIEEKGRGNQYSWKLHWVSDRAENFVVEQNPAEWMNENNTNYAEITGNMVLENGGFAPINNPNAASMGIIENQAYDFSVWTKTKADYHGRLNVQIVDASGTPLSDEKEVTLIKNGEWTKSDTIVLTGMKTKKGKIKLTVSGAEEEDVLYMDMVSLSSQDTYGYGNKNYAYGKGIRKDLAEKLIALDPSFVRFPGGCIIEGNSGRESYYNWEWSVGPLEERKAIANHWASDNGSYTNTYGYMQSFGFGYHEMLQLCEDMGAEPFPILSAGVFCQFSNGDNAPAASGEELDKFAQHATHLIDYCWGNPESDNKTQAEWAGKRVENGHQEPFRLNYIGIGNENWSAKYFDNFEYIKEYVEKYVENNYPERSITIISSSGPAAEDGSYQYAWKRLNENEPGETLVDEHYYQSREFMLNKDDRYDYYSRLEDGGSNVFLGEYATHLNPRNNVLESAICDAAYMTGIERNGDIVRHASYAPLLEKSGCQNWQTNLIHFDDYESMATPNYYVQQMFSNNYGTHIVNTMLEKKGENYTQNTGSPIIGTWATEGYVTHVKVTREDGKILLDEKFDGTSNAKWEAFPNSTGTLKIENGKMSFSQGSGMNCVWLPDTVNDPEWHDYKVEVTAVKTGGQEGFLIGAGAKDEENYIWYNIGGWGNTKSAVQRTRTGAGTWIIGNNQGANYQAVHTNEEMYVTFNYGIQDKLQASYRTEEGIEVNTLNGNLRPYQNDIYQVSSMDEDYIYLKLVNHDTYTKEITISYPGVNAEEAEIICLSGNAGDANSIGNEIITPVTTMQKMEEGQLKYQIPAMSLSVIKVAVDAEITEWPFVDVEKGQWHYDAVAYNYQKGIMSGYADRPDHFGPNDPLARAQFAVILYRMNSEPDVKYKAVFPDVADGVWYTDAILWAADTKVVTGYTDSGKFGPADYINREQMAVMMYRYANYKEYASDAPEDISGYKDTGKVNAFAKEAMAWAVGNGIITGKDSGTVLDPQGNATRAECATIIMRFIEKFEN